MRRIAVRRGRLPSPLTALIGRDGDILDVERLLADHRLVTLTGAGGSGKTRVAIAVAARLRDQLSDGADFVDLQDPRDSDGVVAAMADSLAVTERPGMSLVDSIVDYLADRQV